MAFIVPLITSAATAMGASAATAATIASTVSTAASVLSVAGTVAQAFSARNAANANAKMAKQQATQASQVANQKEEAHRRQAAIFQGEQRAAIGQSGAGFGGSNYDVERQSEILQELDALNIRYEGNVQRSGLLAQASQYKAEGRSAFAKGMFGAAGQLFGMMGSYGDGVAANGPSVSTMGGVGTSNNGPWGTGDWL